MKWKNGLHVNFYAGDREMYNFHNFNTFYLSNTNQW